MFEKVIINVGGQTFVTKTSTLQRYPDTKLANISETCEHFDKTTEVYYFDRNPLIFQSVLDYYRTGKLHFLSNICVEQIRDELQFWEISTTDLGPCCWKYFYTVDSDLRTCRVIDTYFFQRQCFHYSSKSSLTNVKSRILNVLENPRSSKFALVWQIFYLCVVCIAILVSIIQSFGLSRTEMKGDYNETSEEGITKRLSDHDNWIGVVTNVCIVIFTLETSLRLATCPCKFNFFLSFLNVVDIVSVVGCFAHVIVDAFPDSNDAFFTITYALVILQGFRFFRLERFIEGLRIMLLSIKQSKKMLCLLSLILLISSIIFGMTIHIVEMNGDFADAINSFYWAIITMTTIGYGDIYPKTKCGQIIASVCATFGLFLLSMPIAVVANNFTDLYKRYCEHQCHLHQQKKCTWGRNNKTELIPIKN
ncbi:potassium voltage-gated channel subfamily C member 3-like isoform X1 [Mytilus californianus]|uniref:potassium voltage-gated channel subfamily C member 3-like isoform X1 n=1 Tax=Mytilus californianus TaxID=6549 RepID=UPI0022466A73|nr:potassium voltage-gated channel subfamily C member 3-like isoform X1 [Mytilus californianus]